MLRIAVAAAAAAALAVSAGAGAATAPLRYYVSLGDSLAVGYQPGAVRSAAGYPDQLLALQRARPRYRNLRLAKLGCPGETTATLVSGGGYCRYARGSQLRQAEWFLRRNRGRVAFVTIDIGANDVLPCGPTDAACAAAAHPAIRANLSATLRRLRAAAGPGVQIVGADYYAPGLALWLTGETGREQARAYVETIAAPGNAFLRGIYRAHGVRVAQVEAAFSTLDFTTTVELPLVGPVPLNVARICELTWMCLRRDIHANASGYGVIAGAFSRQLR